MPADRAEHRFHPVDSRQCGRRAQRSGVPISFRHSPGGVAAFPSPRKLAQMLALKAPANCLSFFVEGKRRSITGRNSRARASVRPIFSISRPTPDQRHSDPAMEIARVIPAWAPCITPAESCCPRPVRKAQRIDPASSTVQTTLITIAHPSRGNPMPRKRESCVGGTGPK